MWWTPIAAAGVSTLGGLLGGKKQQDTSQEMAREQMAFQERMSNTAHQREVADLRAAGLNPILSAHGGASSPSGAMGTAQNYIGDAAREGVSSAFAGRRLEADLEAIEAGVDKTKADTGVARQMIPNVAQDTLNKQEQLLLTRSLEGKAAADTANAYRLGQNIEQQNLNLQIEGKILEQNLHSAFRAAVADRQRTKFYSSEMGEWLTKIGTGLREVNPLINPVTNSARDLIKR